MFIECVMSGSGHRGLKWRQSALGRLAKSLEALKLEQVRDAHHMADIGPGVGFPGLALAAALPNARVTLVEPDATRCGFLRTTVSEMKLTNVEVVQEAVQHWSEGVGRFDLVTSRGVEAMYIMIRLIAPLMKVGGTLCLWGSERKARDNNPEFDADAVAESIGLIPAGHLVSGKGMAIFAYRRVRAPTTTDIADAWTSDAARWVLPERSVPEESQHERKLQDARARLAWIDAALSSAKAMRLGLEGSESVPGDGKIQRLEAAHAVLAKRIELMVSRADQASGGKAESVRAPGALADLHGEPGAAI